MAWRSFSLKSVDGSKRLRAVGDFSLVEITALDSTLHSCCRPRDTKGTKNLHQLSQRFIYDNWYLDLSKQPQLDSFSSVFFTFSLGSTRNNVHRPNGTVSWAKCHYVTQPKASKHWRNSSNWLKHGKIIHWPHLCLSTDPWRKKHCSLYTV